MSASAAENRIGIAWLIADMSLNIWALSLVKWLGLEVPAVQIVFLRAATGLVLMLPWIWRARGAFRTPGPLGLHALRIALSATALTASFFAIARMPFALFTAISFTRPLVMMALAALILSERVPRHRWAAGVLGLAGVALALGPVPFGWSSGVPALFLTVLAGTGAIIVTRRMKGTPAVVMMTAYTAGLTAITAPVVLNDWTPLPEGTLLPFLAIGLFAQTAQYCFLRAHWAGDASVLGPVSYLSFVLSTGVGFVIFAEVPTPGLLVGAALIILAALWVARDGGAGPRGRTGDGVARRPQ